MRDWGHIPAADGDPVCPAENSVVSHSLLRHNFAPGATCQLGAFAKVGDKMPFGYPAALTVAVLSVELSLKLRSSMLAAAASAAFLCATTSRA